MRARTRARTIAQAPARARDLLISNLQKKMDVVSPALGIVQLSAIA
jgi:hypothetical protein